MKNQHERYSCTQSELLFESPRITLVRERYSDKERNTEFTHLTIRHPGAVVILPIDSQHRVLLVRQYRPSIRAMMLEAPAGALERGETPLLTAQRELREETGFAADKLTPLGILHPTPGFCDEIQHLFCATDLESNPLPGDEDEDLVVERFSAEELRGLIKNGEITDGKTIALISRAELYGML